MKVIRRIKTTSGFDVKVYFDNSVPAEAGQFIVTDAKSVEHIRVSDQQAFPKTRDEAMQIADVFVAQLGGAFRGLGV